MSSYPRSSNDSIQSQKALEVCNAALSHAMAMLRDKSDEIESLKRQHEEQEMQADIVRSRGEAERKEWSAKEAAYLARESEWITKEAAWVDTKSTWESTEARQIVSLAERESEITTLRAQVEQLQSSLTAATSKAETAGKDADFFRAQYMQQSGYVSETRQENEQLKQRAEIAEGQTRAGLAIIRAEAEARVAKLESELKKERDLSALLTERARRTDDGVRSRAALEPEWRRRLGILEERFELRDAQADELEHEVEFLNRKLRKYASALQEKQRTTELRTLQGKSSKAEIPQNHLVSDDDDDESYAPENTSDSSSQDSDNHINDSPGNDGVRDTASKAAKQDITTDLRQEAVTSGTDSVLACRWVNENDRDCDFICDQGSKEVRLFILSLTDNSLN
jgi:hypothetical protein